MVKVPIERVKRVIDIPLRERDVNRRGKVYGWCTGESSRVKKIGEIAADVVFDGVGEYDVLETTGVDLEIIRRITPRAKTL